MGATSASTPPRTSRTCATPSPGAPASRTSGCPRSHCLGGEQGALHSSVPNRSTNAQSLRNLHIARHHPGLEAFTPTGQDEAHGLVQPLVSPAGIPIVSFLPVGRPGALDAERASLAYFQGKRGDRLPVDVSTVGPVREAERAPHLAIQLLLGRASGKACDPRHVVAGCDLYADLVQVPQRNRAHQPHAEGCSIAFSPLDGDAELGQPFRVPAVLLNSGQRLCGLRRAACSQPRASCSNRAEHGR